MMAGGENGGFVTRRELLIGGVMAGASGVAYVRKPKPYVAPFDKLAFEAAVPKSFGEWQFFDSGSVVLPPPDALRDRLYDNLVTRVYVNSTGQAIMLVLAFKNIQDGIVQVHRPEVCYPAAGFTLEDPRYLQMNLRGLSVPAKAFQARRPDRVEQVLYYTRLGQRFPLSWKDQRLAVLEANLNGDIPDGLLARVSMIQDDQNFATVQMRRFFELLAASGGPAFHAVMTGIPRTHK